MTNKPRIIIKLLRDKDEIIEITIKDSVKAIGRSGYVSLPKELVGKYIELNLKVLNQDKIVKTEKKEKHKK